SAKPAARSSRAGEVTLASTRAMPDPSLPMTGTARAMRTVLFASLGVLALAIGWRVFSNGTAPAKPARAAQLAPQTTNAAAVDAPLAAPPTQPPTQTAQATGTEPNAGVKA